MLATIKPELIDRARRAAEASGMRLDQVVVQLGLISEDALRSAAATEMGLAEAGPDSFPVEPLFSGLLAPAFLRHAGLVPLIDQPDFVELAISDPFDSFSPGLVAAKLGKPVRLRLAKKRDIEQAIDDLYGGKETAPGQTPAAELSATDLDRLRDLAGDAPTVQFVDRMIDSAIELGASDIHLSHTARGPRLRYRVDGLLREGDAPPESLYSGTVSRLKIMAGLDIAERRLPQDGHIAVVSRGRAADLRGAKQVEDGVHGRPRVGLARATARRGRRDPRAGCSHSASVRVLAKRRLSRRWIDDCSSAHIPSHRSDSFGIGDSRHHAERNDLLGQASAPHRRLGPAPDMNPGGHSVAFKRQVVQGSLGVAPPGRSFAMSQKSRSTVLDMRAPGRARAAIDPAQRPLRARQSAKSIFDCSSVGG
ncbi:GspE/PulE family protein [Prosthecodimorpha staleyi]|uniref:GspE/PulE family protein n=1 Tax=Prosthecodimorpha staleyi TaxID=2840188 RepID=UPI0021C296BF|nr:ATPase, T2SS/T4P/T4SS family [Prosthecodimorpha staleyi]